MEFKTIPALEARTHLGEIMKRSFKNGERFLVEKSGIPMIAIINAREYEEYVRIMEERQQRFKVVDVIQGKIPDTSSEEIEKDIHEAIQTVRKRRRA